MIDANLSAKSGTAFPHSLCEEAVSRVRGNIRVSAGEPWHAG